ncbi:MAG TPA: hypothetical protein PLP08_05690, partial [Plasticicumulans sp.]|nr:hypothetical protein [Plasticicumulans sp.]
HAPSNPTAIYNLNFIYEREGIFLRPPKIQRGIRFVDVAEGAQPIFELSNTGEMTGGEELAVIGRSTDMLRVMRLARIAAARSPAAKPAARVTATSAPAAKPAARVAAAGKAPAAKKPAAAPAAKTVTASRRVARN